MTEQLYIGLLSGTSIDAIDSAIVSFSNNQVKIIAVHATEIKQGLREEIINLCNPGKDHVELLGKVDVELGHLFGQSCIDLLNKASIKAEEITAIGSHGQTIRHRPNYPIPYTLQIGDPNTIAAITNITTVADFRRRDLAHGGEAAPLAPAFHSYLLQERTAEHIVINIGGIANLTYLPADYTKPIVGFDSGPGNTLLDAWCWKHQRQKYDKNGRWAASGTVNKELLSCLLKDTFFAQSPPKSTGREYFNLAWLDDKLNRLNQLINPTDVQATLLELTAQTITHAIQFFKDFSNGKIWLCGGGAYNSTLTTRLHQLNPNSTMDTTCSLGIEPDWIEACAFAWLAKQALDRKHGNITSVTGAKRPCILGGIYPV